MVRRFVCSQSDVARAAANAAADCIRTAIRSDGKAVIVLATGCSQIAVLAALTQQQGIAWQRVTAFHLDEYIGLAADHPGSFRYYLHDRFMKPLGGRPQLMAIAGDGHPDAEMARLTQAIASENVHVCFAGIGTNGHLAFNDPPADFNTYAPYIRVRLSEDNRQQQVRDGWFHALDAVPREAMTMSVRQIMKSDQIIVTVTGAHKAPIMRAVLEGPVTPACPASILQIHPHVSIYMDEAAAALLTGSHARMEYPLPPR